MAQRNPITQAESLESTGSTHAPIGTDSSYTNTSSTTGPTHGAGYATSTGNTRVVDNRTTGQKVKDVFKDGGSSTGTTTNTGTGNVGTAGAHTTAQSTAPSHTEQKVNTAASGVGGVFAGLHGAGEKIRGEFNAGVDRAFNEPEGVVKNEGVARQGEGEIESGRFSGSTREREVGSGERRI